MHRPLYSCSEYGGGGLCQFRGKFLFFRMVEHVLQVTSDYEKRLAGSQYVPKFSFQRRMLRDDGASVLRSGQRHSLFEGNRSASAYDAV